MNSPSMQRSKEHTSEMQGFRYALCSATGTPKKPENSVHGGSFFRNMVDIYDVCKDAHFDWDGSRIKRLHEASR